MEQYKTYDTCSRCKGANDRPKQRECAQCHRESMKTYRANKNQADLRLNELLDRYEARIAALQAENAGLLARIVAAEGVIPRGISRETITREAA